MLSSGHELILVLLATVTLEVVTSSSAIFKCKLEPAILARQHVGLSEGANSGE
jgi:hypothetical protein